jgi:hypothetical protein
MSTPNSCDTKRSVAPSADSSLSRAFARTEYRLRRLSRAVSFWAAVVLPFVAFGFLASGLTSTVEWALFLSLLLVNAVTLYLGHAYCIDRFSE